MRLCASKKMLCYTTQALYARCILLQLNWCQICPLPVCEQRPSTSPLNPHLTSTITEMTRVILLLELSRPPVFKTFPELRCYYFPLSQQDTEMQVNKKFLVFYLIYLIYTPPVSPKQLNTVSSPPFHPYNLPVRLATLTMCDWLKFPGQSEKSNLSLQKPSLTTTHPQAPKSQ